MKFMEIIAAIATIIGLITSLIDLLSKKILGKRIFNRTVLYILLYAGIFAAGFSLNSFIGWYYAKEKIVIPDEEIISLRKSNDFLLGRLNKKIEEYEKQIRNPLKERIILFEHVNYRGRYYYLEPGDDASLDLRLCGFGNIVSSIKVEGALEAQAYSGINYSEFPHLPIERDIPSLYVSNWNDKILSINVEKKARP